MSEASARSAVTLLVAALLLAGVALNAAAIARAKSARADFSTSRVTPLPDHPPHLKSRVPDFGDRSVAQVGNIRLGSGEETNGRN